MPDVLFDFGGDRGLGGHGVRFVPVGVAQGHEELPRTRERLDVEVRVRLLAAYEAVEPLVGLILLRAEFRIEEILDFHSYLHGGRRISTHSRHDDRVPFFREVFSIFGVPFGDFFRPVPASFETFQLVFRDFSEIVREVVRVESVGLGENRFRSVQKIRSLPDPVVGMFRKGRPDRILVAHFPYFDHAEGEFFVRFENLEDAVARELSSFLENLREGFRGFRVVRVRKTVPNEFFELPQRPIPSFHGLFEILLGPVVVGELGGERPMGDVEGADDFGSGESPFFQ